MKLFYYFNGFNSAILEDFSGSAKIVSVAAFAQKTGFRFVPVSINFRRAANHRKAILDEINTDVEEVIFCGSSMGGWFARIMQLSLTRLSPGIRTAAIGFNPAFDMSLNEEFLIGPQMNFVTLEKYEWTADHARQLRILEEMVDYDAAQPFYVYCDKGDEVIPWEASASRHREISRFKAYEGGCHSFDHTSEALRDFYRWWAVIHPARMTAPIH